MSAKSKKAPAEKPEAKEEAPEVAPETTAAPEDPRSARATPEPNAAEAGDSSRAKPDDVGAQAAERILGPNPMVNIRGKDLLQVAKGIATAALQQPQKIVEHYARFLGEAANIVQGKSKIRPEKGDRRWWDPAWGKSKL